MNNVISTRVSVYRNLKDYKFENKLTAEQKQEIVEKIQQELKTKMQLQDTQNLSEASDKALNEKALILPGCRNIFVNKQNDLVINMFSGEHISIVSAGDGFNMKTIEKALDLAQNLSNKISFAFSDEFGYLMSDVAKIGAGIRIETNIMLNAIKSINKIDQVKQNLAKLGYSLNETKLSAVYTLSTTCNLGIGEKQICADFENTLVKLQELEIESVKMLDVSKHDEIVDKSQRSLAILGAAYMLNYEELYNMSVNLRIAANLGIVNLETEKLNDLHKLLLSKRDELVTVEQMKALAKKVQEILKGESHV